MEIPSLKLSILARSAIFQPGAAAWTSARWILYKLSNFRVARAFIMPGVHLRKELSTPDWGRTLNASILQVYTCSGYGRELSLKVNFAAPPFDNAHQQHHGGPHSFNKFLPLLK
jgi:hypothetical protein